MYKCTLLHIRAVSCRQLVVEVTFSLKRDGVYLNALFEGSIDINLIITQLTTVSHAAVFVYICDHT